MPIFTAISSGGARSGGPHPLFIQRGIKDLTHATLSELQFACLATSKEIAYSGYKDNIDLFVAATIKGKRLHTFETGVDVMPEEIIEMPFNYPPIAFEFREPVKEEVMNKFIEKNSESKVSYEPIQKTKAMVAHTPTLGFLKRLHKFAKQSGPCRMDTMEPVAVKWVSFLWLIISNFLRTNTYPAYMDSAGDTQMCLRLARELTMVEVESKVATAYRGRYYTALGTDDPVDLEGDAGMVIDHKHTSGWSIEDTVLHCKPSPAPIGTNIGGPGDVPNLPGILFPYFAGLNIADKKYIRTIVSRYFLRLFGDSTASVKKGYSAFRHEIDTFSTTSLGICFAHMLFGIDLTLNTQTRMFVIVERQKYHGFVLLGARFNIHNGITWHAPLESADLRAELNTMGTHDSAIAALVSLMNGLKMRTAPKIAQPFTTPVVRNSSVLADMMTSVEWTEEALKLAESNLTALAFPGSYRSINLENLQWAMALLCDTSKALPGDMLFYIPSKSFESIALRDYRIFAAFGPSSFSFINTKGKEYAIAKPGVADPLDVIDEKSKQKALPHLLIHFKPIANCLKDWDKMKKKRIVQMDLKERAQAHRSYHFSGPQRDKIMTMLKENFAKLKLEEPKKRKAGDDETMDDGSKKRHKAVQEDVEFALFSDDEEM